MDLELKEDKSVGNRSFKIGWLAKGALVVGALALFAMTSTSANAASLRRAGTTGSGEASLNGGTNGNYLSTWYGVSTSDGNGDNVLRLDDPNGCGDGGINASSNCSAETDQCAMIYVFDDDQEMAECCGCPITPNELQTYSVESNLTANWGLPVDDNGSGIIVVVGSSFNVTACNVRNTSCGSDGSPGLSPGCDPTAAPVTAGDTALDGSITHNQKIGTTSGLTEIPLFNNGAGDATNNAYLVSECSSLIANSSTKGSCTCPGAT
jgi:hypothetical protein